MVEGRGIQLARVGTCVDVAAANVAMQDTVAVTPWPRLNLTISYGVRLAGAPSLCLSRQRDEIRIRIVVETGKFQLLSQVISNVFGNVSRPICVRIIKIYLPVLRHC